MSKQLIVLYDKTGTGEPTEVFFLDQEKEARQAADDYDREAYLVEAKLTKIRPLDSDAELSSLIGKIAKRVGDITAGVRCGDPISVSHNLATITGELNAARMIAETLERRKDAHV